MRLLLYRSATVHNNERLASPHGDARTKVRRSARFISTLRADVRPLVGQLTLPDVDAAAGETVHNPTSGGPVRAANELS